MRPTIRFHYVFKKPFYFPKRNSLKQFLFWIFKNEKRPIDAINYIFCSDTDLLKLNRVFLKHNTRTDIITFPLSDSDLPVISDIYINIERIIDNSTLLKVSFKKELLRVIFHGALHLCGYNDKTRKDKIIIRDMEDFYLNQYLVSRETAS